MAHQCGTERGYVLEDSPQENQTGSDSSAGGRDRRVLRGNRGEEETGYAASLEYRRHRDRDQSPEAARSAQGWRKKEREQNSHARAEHRRSYEPSPGYVKYLQQATAEKTRELDEFDKKLENSKRQRTYSPACFLEEQSNTHTCHESHEIHVIQDKTPEETHGEEGAQTQTPRSGDEHISRTSNGHLDSEDENIKVENTFDDKHKANETCEEEFDVPHQWESTMMATAGSGVAGSTGHISVENLLDTGCTKTVCGSTFYKQYKHQLRLIGYTKRLRQRGSTRRFVFGGGDRKSSTRAVRLPIYPVGKRVYLWVDIVQDEPGLVPLPLLISLMDMRDTLQMTLDMPSNTATVMGVALQFPPGGRVYRLDLLGRKPEETESDTSEDEGPVIRMVDDTSYWADRLVVQAAFTAKAVQTMASEGLEALEDEALYNRLDRLHKTLLHPKEQRFKKFLRNAGITQNRVFKMVGVIVRECHTCRTRGRPLQRPEVAIPLADDFNRCVAIDIAWIE